MKIIFKQNLVIDGMAYEKGQSYEMPDWLALRFINGGVAEEPRKPGRPKKT